MSCTALNRTWQILGRPLQILALFVRPLAWRFVLGAFGGLQSYFNFHVKIGTNVAKINEQNSNDCETNDGKKSIGNIIPAKIDLEKSGVGNNNMPATKPIIMDIYEFFSFKDFE